MTLTKTLCCVWLVLLRTIWAQDDHAPGFGTNRQGRYDNRIGWSSGRGHPNGATLQSFIFTFIWRFEYIEGHHDDADSFCGAVDFGSEVSWSLSAGPHWPERTSHVPKAGLVQGFQGDYSSSSKIIVLTPFLEGVCESSVNLPHLQACDGVGICVLQAHNVSKLHP